MAWHLSSKEEYCGFDSRLLHRFFFLKVNRTSVPELFAKQLGPEKVWGASPPLSARLHISMRNAVISFLCNLGLRENSMVDTVSDDVSDPEEYELENEWWGLPTDRAIAAEQLPPAERGDLILRDYARHLHAQGDEEGWRMLSSLMGNKAPKLPPIRKPAPAVSTI